MRKIKCEDNLYKKYPRQSAPQDAYIEIDYANQTLSADWNAEIGNAIPMSLWNNWETRISIDCQLTVEAINEILDAVEHLAAQICDEFEREGERGVLTERGQDLLSEFEALVVQMNQSLLDGGQWFRVVDSLEEWFDSFDIDFWKGTYSSEDALCQLTECGSYCDIQVKFEVTDADIEEYLVANLIENRHQFLKSAKEWRILPKWIQELNAIGEWSEDYLKIDAEEAFHLQVLYRKDGHAYVGDGGERFWVKENGLTEKFIPFDPEDEENAGCREFDTWCTEWIDEYENEIRIYYQDNSDGKGWVVWEGEDRRWQPVVGFEDPEAIPAIEDIEDMGYHQYIDELIVED